MKSKKIFNWIFNRINNLLGYPNCSICGTAHDIDFDGHCWACECEIAYSN